MAETFFRDFFTLYKSLPCLWNKNDPKYNDEHQKDISMMHLAKMYRTRSPNATQVDIRNKLKIFMKCLQKDHKRYLKKGSTANSEAWYYKHLSFLLEDYRSKPAVIQGKKLKQTKKAVKRKVVPKNNQTPNDGKETSVHTNMAAAKKPSATDKYDKVTEKLKSLPTGQFSLIEDILENIYKFAHHENKEPMDDDLLASTSSQEAPQPIVANTKTVQVAQSTTVDTKMTSVHADLNKPCGSTPPNMSTSSTITSRQDAPGLLVVNTETVQGIQSNIHLEITPVQTNLNSLSGPNLIISSRPEEPQSIAANMETVHEPQSNTIDTQMTSEQTNLNKPGSPNSLEQNQTTQSEPEVIWLSD